MGPALCLVSAACFGALAIFGKFAYDAGVSPSALLLVRFALAAALLWLVLLVRPELRRTDRSPGSGGDPAPGSGGDPAAPAPGVRVFAIAVGLGAVGYAAQASLFFAALRLMDASPLSLILYTFPVLVTVGAVLLGRDRLTARRGIALVTASTGTLLVLAGAGSFHPVGALLGFGSAVVYTVYILVADTIVHRLPPVLLSALVMTGAAGTLAARAAVTGGVDLRLSPAAWGWLACIAVVSTVAAMLTFFAGLRRTGPSTAAILSTFEPVVTTALAALTLGEFLTPLQLLGGALVLSSVAVLQTAPRKAGPTFSATAQGRRVDVRGDLAAHGRGGVAGEPGVDAAEDPRVGRLRETGRTAGQGTGDAGQAGGLQHEPGVVAEPVG
ncbi:DMT family transporter [Dactylosporangium siamense]|nr:DMT family transporter [Dactylosporangium siamense]